MILSAVLLRHISPQQHGVFVVVLFRQIYYFSRTLFLMKIPVIKSMPCTDFSKAFDKINHYMLLTFEVGIHGDLPRWLKSFIEKLTQAISLKGCISDSHDIPSFVAQQHFC